VRPIDVCRAGSDSFVVMAGVGFDARMMDATSPELKRELGWLGYGLAAGRTIVAVGVPAANIGTLTGASSC
jgi:diacylglycerol kinase family enzyme